MRPGGLMAESLLTSRERVLALVTSQPGLHLRELPRRLGLSLRSVRYHLEGLEESERVTPHRSGRFERWFAAGAFPAAHRTLLPAPPGPGPEGDLPEPPRGGPVPFAAPHERAGPPA